MDTENSSAKPTSRWWFKYILVFIIFVCFFTSGFLLYKIIKIKQNSVLGTSISVINKSNNSLNTDSSLKFYYEPTASSIERDTTPWLTEEVNWTYNNDTLNDRFDYSVEKPSTTYRIIALGDSFTFGDHVNTADPWPEQLEDMLNSSINCSKYDKYEVLNLGLRGFDIQDEVERYKIRGSKYNADLVLWMLIWNDFEEINELLPNVQESVAEEQKKDPSKVSINDTNIYKTILEEFRKNYSENQIFSLLTSYVSQFNGFYQGPLLVVTFPTMDDKYKNLMKEWTSRRPYGFFFDGLTDIYAKEPLHLSDDHPSKIGHKFITQDIYNYISQKFLSCK